jgi:hypothetical protein
VNCLAGLVSNSVVSERDGERLLFSGSSADGYHAVCLFCFILYFLDHGPCVGWY